jgi:Arc/MetJ-type ribon-helix-helix transcriptional regulator
VSDKEPEGAEGLGKQILEQLRSQGVDLTALACGDDAAVPARVVCVAANVGHMLDQMGRSTRDQVVMVRVDADTAEKLDAWVETGAVKSRSEAAALFIREGLQVRRQELDELQDAIDDVEKARERLRERVQEVLGTGE